jgi:hypothetical protein
MSPPRIYGDHLVSLDEGEQVGVADADGAAEVA